MQQLQHGIKQLRKSNKTIDALGYAVKYVDWNWLIQQIMDEYDQNYYIQFQNYLQLMQI